MLSADRSAHASLDALLATQGWRRFAEQDPHQFRKEHKNDRDAERLLVLNGQTPQTINLDTLAVQKVTDKYKPLLAPLQEKLARAKDQHDAVESETAQRHEVLVSERSAARAELQSAYQAFAQHQATVQQIKTIALPALTLTLLIAGVITLLLGIRGA